MVGKCPCGYSPLRTRDLERHMDVSRKKPCPQAVAEKEKKKNHPISVDELADWLTGPERDYKPKKSDIVTFDEWADKYERHVKETPNPDQETDSEYEFFKELGL